MAEDRWQAHLSTMTVTDHPSVGVESVLGTRRTLGPGITGNQPFGR